MKRNGRSGEVNDLFDGVIADAADDKGKIAFFGRLEMKATQGIRGSAVIGAFQGKAGAPEGMSFAIFDGAGNQGLRGQRVEKQDKCGRYNRAYHSRKFIAKLN